MKKILKTLLIVLACVVVLCLGYLSYVWFSYYRIEDNLNLDINNNQTSSIELNTEYSIVTSNIGFGAYEENYSFFMDTTMLADGSIISGEHSRALSKENEINNTSSMIEEIKKLNTDFCFFQEVDTDSTRSYHVNQKDMITEEFSGYGYSYASNYHSSYLAYPFNEPIGKSNSGILTLSKNKIDSSNRRSFPLSDKKIDNLLDLDRCFMITKIKVSEEKFLVLINIHMSAYDSGGIVREKQVNLLKEVLNQEKDNYVLVGGDFNQLLNDTKFETTELDTSWVNSFPKEEIPSGFSIVSSTNAPTCRSAATSYVKGVTNSWIIDGFIVSDNISVISCDTVDLEFKYSDHNPVKLIFKLI